jgi:hypothetical protein
MWKKAPPIRAPAAKAIRKKRILSKKDLLKARVKIPTSETKLTITVLTIIKVKVKYIHNHPK